MMFLLYICRLITYYDTWKVLSAKQLQTCNFKSVVHFDWGFGSARQRFYNALGFV